MKKTIEELTRANVRALVPYSCARDEYKGKAATVFLDANENPYNAPYDRYPDPLQTELKAAIAQTKQGVGPENIFLGNGSDEAIDLLFRAFCEPRQDNVVAIEPTYGMYRVAAEINDVEYRSVLLDEGFRLNASRLLAAADGRTKLVFLCSPNNPNGNSLDRGEIMQVIDRFPGLVVLDEAYIDFSAQESFTKVLAGCPNLVVLQTFSKAWASAGVRLGMAFASAEVIGTFNKIKYPYNVNRLTQEYALELLRRRQDDVKGWVEILLRERGRLMDLFAKLPVVREIYPTDANFFLAKMTDAAAIYRYLVEAGIIVRNRSGVALCADCLRVTVGTPEEDDILLEALRNYTER